MRIAVSLPRWREAHWLRHHTCACLVLAPGRGYTSSAQRRATAWNAPSGAGAGPSASAGADRIDTAQMRNISIIAHIDAGKTTCTERILHLTQRPSVKGRAAAAAAAPGDVDTGSTITDFLDAERERGITIQSAAVGPVWWRKRTNEGDSGDADKDSGTAAAITLVDTPGHVDFTIEVERAVRVVDGTVVVLDAVEGVEAQTERVWAQAARYGLRAHLVFVNKLDRAGASLRRSVRSLVRKGLHARPLVLQLPVYRQQQHSSSNSSSSSSSSSLDTQLHSLVDILRMELLTFSGAAGQTVHRTPLNAAASAQDQALLREALLARSALLETLASADEALLEALLDANALGGEHEGSSALPVPLATVQAAIRRQTLAGHVVPVLCGAAARNIGIPPLLDAIADFLPSPLDMPPLTATVESLARATAPACAGTGSKKVKKHPAKRAAITAAAGRKKDSASAAFPAVPGVQEHRVQLNDTYLSLLAFKVVWSATMGAQTFVRVYSGTLTRSGSGSLPLLYNTATQRRERVGRMFLCYADEYIEVAQLRAGQIGVLVGLQDTCTGDTLVDDRQAIPAKEIRTLHLPSIAVPPPVFSMSIEPYGKSDEAPLRDALHMLVRTDPSLRLDDHSLAETGGGTSGTAGQATLSGMGELHLDIAKGRLRDEFKVRASLGAVRVNYREAPCYAAAAVTVEEQLDRVVGGRRLQAACTLTLEALDGHGGSAALEDNVIEMDLAPLAPTAESDGALALVSAHEAELRRGLHAALSRGPLAGGAVSGARITLRSVQAQTQKGDTDSSAAALSAVASRALRTALRRADMALLEPYMRLAIHCDAGNVGRVVSDLTSEQHGEIVEIRTYEQQEQPDKHERHLYLPPETDAAAASSYSSSTTSSRKVVVHAKAPLSSLVAYSSRLRALTAGAGSFEMAFLGYQQVQAAKQHAILRELGRL